MTRVDRKKQTNASEGVFPSASRVYLYKKCEKKMMKKYDLVFTIECLSESIAVSVEKDLKLALKKLYRDIIVKSKTIEHPTFEGILDLSEATIEGRKIKDLLEMD